MHQLSITDAAKVVPVSESTLRRDLKSGKVSFTTDKQKKKVIDVSELSRVYGDLTIIDTPKNGNDNEKIVALLETQITSLQTQLTQASERETSLLDLLKEKEKNLALMTPPPEKKPFFFGLFRNRKPQESR